MPEKLFQRSKQTRHFTSRHAKRREGGCQGDPIWGTDAFSRFELELAMMDQASEPKQNQNREAVATGRTLKFLKTLECWRPFSVESLAGRYRFPVLISLLIA